MTAKNQALAKDLQDVNMRNQIHTSEVSNLKKGLATAQAVESELRQNLL